MFSRLEIVNPAIHGAWRLRQFSYDFSRRIQAVPVTLAEFSQLSRHSPIVFVDRGQGHEPCALLGLRADENLMVDADGEWVVETAPLHLRRYPFILLATEDNGFIMGLDADAPGWIKNASGEGSAIFEADGKTPVAAVSKVLATLVELQNDLTLTQEFCSEIAVAGLFSSGHLMVRIGEREIKLEDFHIIDEDKFLALPIEKWAEWRAKGWIRAIYAHLQSLDALRDLGRRLDARAAA